MSAPAVEAGPAVPRPYRVISRHVDTADTVTLTLEPDAGPLAQFAPGQFAMLTAYGIGEVPVSVSAIAEPGQSRARRLVHTLRAVGAVTRALHAAQPGAVIGVRGPFGTAWDEPSAAGQDVVIVAGGIGLAPLRPLVHAILADRRRYRHVVLLIGGRTPADLLYRDEVARFAAAAVEVAVTVDRPAPGWTGQVGVVTTLVPPARFDPARTVAFLCGPEIMMRFTAQALIGRGVPASRVRVSLERNMRCAVGWCGHCQLGPLLLCRDGPVVDYARAQPLISVREL
ncbi:FAD/NAD(P)-binding protein [Actinoplanes teichomyceticus]|uniref:NAD(P)H-flavin reductase n=1 Tax=Actinoplanes teichomyceticus TaxID=1867 RepID=A0A561VLS5_ACTTI|nr:FAD/NAD(P)-binding protein [Actinoplanes teichomyceticus]TWG12558.1 NAD(P)H-flavin reductase [Actinoplanes teichomyceticus]GIF13924.1 oxidoreductase [Actinoplanes teichomyceticus]